MTTPPTSLTEYDYTAYYTFYFPLRTLLHHLLLSQNPTTPPTSLTDSYYTTYFPHRVRLHRLLHLLLPSQNPTTPPTSLTEPYYTTYFPHRLLLHHLLPTQSTTTPLTTPSTIRNAMRSSQPTMNLTASSPNQKTGLEMRRQKTRNEERPQTMR